MVLVAVREAAVTSRGQPSGQEAINDIQRELVDEWQNKRRLRALLKGLWHGIRAYVAWKRRSSLGSLDLGLVSAYLATTVLALQPGPDDIMQLLENIINALTRFVEAIAHLAGRA